MDNAPAELTSVPSIPDSFQDNPYFALNDNFAQSLKNATDEAERLAVTMETWQVAACRLRAQEKSITAIAKEVRKKPSVVSEFFRTLAAQRLANQYACISILKAPIPKNVRAHMLWRIAVDNEKIQPDIARKAVNDLNAMLDPKTQGGGQTLQIVINNEVLPRGNLDG